MNGWWGIVKMYLGHLLGTRFAHGFWRPLESFGTGCSLRDTLAMNLVIHRILEDGLLLIELLVQLAENRLLLLKLGSLLGVRGRHEQMLQFMALADQSFLLLLNLLQNELLLLESIHLRHTICCCLRLRCNAIL